MIVPSGQPNVSFQQGIDAGQILNVLKDLIQNSSNVNLGGGSSNRNNNIEIPFLYSSLAQMLSQMETNQSSQFSNSSNFKQLG